ncbi:MAG: preprotein translocase subunit SecE [Actinomycetota bacterium]
MTQVKVSEPEGRGVERSRRGLLGRVGLFIRQVVSELRKVVRPTRTELMTYTAVCMVFVVVVMSYVALLDLGIGTAIRKIFAG